MKHSIVFGLLFFIFSCSNPEKQDAIVLTGKVDHTTSYIIINKDTIHIDQGQFSTTLPPDMGQYDYIQLSSWKYPKLIYIEGNSDINIDFSMPEIIVKNDDINSYLLNIDSILTPYTLRWDMDEDLFRTTLQSELLINMNKIDSIFPIGSLSTQQLTELKLIEKLKIAHRTANFINYKKRNDIHINRDIYNFIIDSDLNNQRLEKQINNINFQYYFLLDKVNDNLPDSIYPFAVIDTVNKYSKIESIRKMIISSTTTSAFYSEDVNHNRLISVYEDNFGKLEKTDKLLSIFDQTQKLKPGNSAPSIGQLEDINGNHVTINDLKGQNVLITVWGTWCPYCKTELKALQKLIQVYGDKFISVGISYDKNKTKWRSYVNDNNWDGIHLIDPEKKSRFKSNFLINSTNVHILIDKEGVILSNKSIKPSNIELETLIKKLK